MQIIIKKDFKYLLEREEIEKILELICDNPLILDKLKAFSKLQDSEINSESLATLQKIFSSYDISMIRRKLNLFFHFLGETSGSLKINLTKTNESANRTRSDLLDVFKKYREIIKPYITYLVFRGIKIDSGIMEENGAFQLTGKSLHKFFRSNDKKGTAYPLIIYVATIGEDLDNQVSKLSGKNGDIYEAYLLNGIGAGYIDTVVEDLELCFQDRFKNELNGRKLVRVSPGYGDWILSDQKVIFDVLKPENSIKVILNKSFLMQPIKSTSGLIRPI